MESIYFVSLNSNLQLDILKCNNKYGAKPSLNMPKKQSGLASKIFTYFICETAILIISFGAILYFNPYNILSDIRIVLTLISLLFILLNIIFYLILKKNLKPLRDLNHEIESLDPLHLKLHLNIKSGNELEEVYSRLSNTFTKIQSINDLLNVEKNSLIADKTRLSEAITNMTEGLIGINSNCKIIIFNRIAQNLSGLSENEALGKEPKEIFRLSNKEGEISQLIYCPLEATSENDIIYSEKNLTVTTLKNNRKATVNLSTTKIHQFSKFGFKYIINLQDVTQSKDLEDMKFDFVSMAAHELRTPLTSIKGYLAVFMQENKDKLTPDQKMLLDNITQSSERLTSLVENLLSVSRIERGGLTINIQSIDWMDLVKTIVKDHTERAKEKQIDIKLIEPPTVIPQIHADKLRMGEVMSNLLSNAIKYSEPHGIITVSVETNGKEVITHVSDTGHGIPEDSLPYLFNKFFRVNSKLEAQTKGNGLGLYITKAVVELHHGKIWVKSRVGQGSVFSFSIPL